MTTYYLDINRGADGNSGTSAAAPWQNLSKLAGLALPNGTSVLLARDSIWPLSAYVSLGTVSGTSGNSVYIGPYDTALEKSAKPQINLTYSLAAGDWTYDGTNGGWYASVGASPFNVGDLSLVLLGGQIAYNQTAALPLAASDLFWKTSGTRLYVYAPAGADPTTYYGSAVVGPQFRGGLHSSNQGVNLIVESLSSQHAAAPFSTYLSGGTKSILVRNLELVGSAPFAAQLDKTGSGTQSVTVDGLVAYGGSPSASVHLVEINSGSHTFSSAIVRNCNITDGNYGTPQGGIYIQCTGALIEQNYVARMRYGTPAHQQDGSGIYVDLGSSGAIVRQNTVEDCAIAMQNGSVDLATWQLNVTRNCTCAMGVANGAAIATVEHRYQNNTNIGVGTAQTVYGGVAAPIGAHWAYRSGIKPIIQNSVFDCVSGIPAFSQPSGGFASGATVDKNSAFGYGALTAVSFGSGSGPLSPTNTVTSDPLVTADGIPMTGSPLLTASTWADIGYLETATGQGKQFGGAFCPATLRAAA